MSVDFGPIPLPHSPLQDYFDRKYRRTSETTSAASSAVTSPLGDCSVVEQHLVKALADLAKKQNIEATILSSREQRDEHPHFGADESTQRRESLATSSGYAAALATGLMKRRRGQTGADAASRRP
ncbi:uncharacterized protein LTR77_011112 [Saxophila tyrrhenica]|uniref:Uncharacterized protein n=1 Tax=Saxophila tyrrhenica TaxID=1690608 RepID=A0AAV9NV29_9PEZI|nr:hypothetical protein LTR77_011112 [Saxophila tyrrhenica]